jgi:hypothetical protein
MKKQIKNIIVLFLCGIVLVLAYRGVYNFYYGSDVDKKIDKYLIEPRKILDYVYLYKFTKSGSLNRIPQVLFAVDNIRKDSVSLFVGVGAGNASNSFFVKGVGEYYRTNDGLRIDDIFVGNLLWEYGVIGTLLYFCICGSIFLLAIRMRKMNGLRGVVAVWFLGMSIILAVSTLYFNTMRINVFLYVYWFVGGWLTNEYCTGRGVKG